MHMNPLLNSRAIVSAPFFYAFLLNRLTKKLIRSSRKVWMESGVFMPGLMKGRNVLATTVLFEGVTIGGR